MKRNPTDDEVRAAFLKRFTGPNGKCKHCGAQPDPDWTSMRRAMWYAKHVCDAAEQRKKDG